MRYSIWMAALFCAVFAFSGGGEASGEPFRIGLTKAAFTMISTDDASAAVKFLGVTIIKEGSVPLVAVPIVLGGVEDILSTMRSKQVDAIILSTPEFGRTHHLVPFSPIFATRNANLLTESFVVVAHRKGPVKSIADLRNRTLYVHDMGRNCLSRMWLDTVLDQKKLPLSSSFLARVKMETKLSKAVLPVFFRQGDACLVTRDSFNTMVELNPQLGEDLTILAESPGMVPLLFVFRADFKSTYRDIIVKTFEELHQTVTGQQALTLFSIEAMEIIDLAFLKPTIELIASYDRLLKRTQRR
ncbi:MAG: PhnD/SsuA/transferrin family substrate-binding protein [Deltaproteobacteria bacterium]|nr:PhnD/SsuA/transferrin family substrate-binding protein [Deltaproteobacteria bacterium]